MRRLLITGARGFIGRHALSQALAASFEVHATTSSSGPADIDDAQPATWHSLDLLRVGEVERIIERVRPSHILHLAWTTEHGRYWTSPANLDWLALGARMARSFAQSGGARFVSVGSCAEYDWTGDGHMVDSITPERPATFYGKIKLAHHQMIMAAASQFGFSAATGRVFFIYGPNEGPDRIVAYACRELAQARTATFSSGTQCRDFLHVADAAAGLIALLDAPLEGTCNVSSGEAPQLRDVVMLIAQLAGHSDLVRFDPTMNRPNDPPVILGDSTRLRATGWRPRIALRDGLAECLDWWKASAGGQN